MNLIKFKNLIEQNPVAFSTTTKFGKPNVIGVSGVKVISDNELIVTDNYMNQTILDLAENNNVCLVVWNKEFNGCKIIGEASYYSEGRWVDFVKNLPENDNFPAKGAILVKINQIIESK